MLTLAESKLESTILTEPLLVNRLAKPHLTFESMLMQVSDMIHQ